MILPGCKADPRKKMKAKQQWGLLLAVGLSLLAYGGLVSMQWRYGTLRDGRTPETIAWYLLAFGAYLGILVWTERRDAPWRWLWGTAVLVRLLLLFTTPTLSDDVYRYLWDGHVTAHGVSPYAYAVNDPALDYLEAPARSLVNNGWMASPYLPAAQLVFGGVTAVAPLRPLAMQSAMIIFDLFSAWLIARLLSLANLPPRRLLLYLWNPLVIVEVAHGAHIDAWMILLALLALTFTLRRASSLTPHSSSLAPLFLALATLTKILPLLLFPVLFWQWTWRQRITFGLLTVGLLVPFGWQAGWGLGGQLDGTGLFGALRIYGRQWRFNSGLFHWLEQFLSRRGVADSVGVSKMMLAMGMVLVVTAVFLRARHLQEPIDILRVTAVPFIAYILFTPTLHPWYLLILLIFLPFLPPAAQEPRRRWLLALPWIYLSGALIFSYLTYLDPLNFGELEWVRQLEWLPPLSMLGLSAMIHWGANRLQWPQQAARW